MAGGAQGASGRGKSVDACAGRARRKTSRVALGEGRHDLYVRYSAWPQDAGGTVQRTQPVDRLSLHVRAGLGGGCPGCSFVSDHIDGALQHVEQRDVAYVAVSRAPLEKIEAFRKRMGWHFRWVSSFGSDFNYDYHVSFTSEQREKGKVYYNFEMNDVTTGGFGSDELPGLSVFYKDDAGDVFHTFSAYGRGGEPLIGTYSLLDLTPKGRDEEHNMMDWLRHHDRYDEVRGGADTGAAATNAASQREAGRTCH